MMELDREVDMINDGKRQFASNAEQAGFLNHDSAHST